MDVYNIENSNAFVNTFYLEPLSTGILDNLSFAVKDLIDVRDDITGCGNPSWRQTQDKAFSHAICVEQLLLSGAACLGKTITDEFAYSLIGENYFYGTPINPKAPNCVPGGSSSGSASAVACGLVDFALGTDTGGSVRVPASNCGIWGYRPSHGLISLAGVMPFAPSLDTVGVLAKNGEILHKVAQVLLGTTTLNIPITPDIILLEDIFSICDNEVKAALLPVATQLSSHTTSLLEICEQPIDYTWLYDIYVVTQSTEVWNSLSVALEKHKPMLGPITQFNLYQLAKRAQRERIQECIEKRAVFTNKLNKFLYPNKILCFPTTPTLAPKRGTITLEARTTGTYYPRALGMNAIAGLAKLPQITIPIAMVDNIPIGLSFVAAYAQDIALSTYIKNIFTQAL